MNNELSTDTKGLAAAIALVRQDDIPAARVALGISRDLTDTQVVEALIGFDKGLELFTSQRPMESLEHFQKARLLVEASDDEEARYLLPIFMQLGEGLCALFSGNAHAAAELLNVGAEALDRLRFFAPQFTIASISFRAAGLTALAKVHLNAADITSAERVVGELGMVHNEMLNHLDPNENDHALGFAEVYGSRCEWALAFIQIMDLPSLDLNMWKQRLGSARSDLQSLNKVLDGCPQGPVRSILSAVAMLFPVHEQLLNSLEIAVLKRRPFRKSDVRALANVATELFKIRQLVQTCGERGRGLLVQLDQLARLQRNVLQMGKTVAENFGRFSGLVSCVSFIVLIVVMHSTVEPGGYAVGLYYFGAMILSLVVGFGYGALRFQPLLKLFTEATKKGANSG